MNLRGSAMYLFICMVCINAFSYMLYSVDIRGVKPEPGWNETEIQNSMDMDTVIGSWDWNIEFYDLVFAVKWFIGAMWGMIMGFPQLCTEFQVPSFITTPMYFIWSILWGVVVMMAWVGGRDV